MKESSLEAFLIWHSVFGTPPLFVPVPDGFNNNKVGLTRLRQEMLQNVTTRSGTLHTPSHAYMHTLGTSTTSLQLGRDRRDFVAFRLSELAALYCCIDIDAPTVLIGRETGVTVAAWRVSGETEGEKRRQYRVLGIW